MLWKDSKGAAVVEFALVLPLFLLLVFGVIEFGFLLYNQAMLTNAAREGARAGITVQSGSRLTTADIITVVNDYLCVPNATSCDSLLVSFSSSTTAPSIITKVNGTEADPGIVGLAEAEDFLTVEVTYDYDFLVVPSLITSMGIQKTLFASATMRAE